MAQWIARGPPKAEVGGSSPPKGDFFYYLITCIQVCMTRHDRFRELPECVRTVLEFTRRD